MWCTRWFLPLLLLPLPIASPYFLFLYFFSLTLHARPCFYCIILLTALFTSSCYWQPVPTHALLKTSFTNVSQEAPLWYSPNASLPDDGAIPSSQLFPMPSLVGLLDRCWCDLSGGHLFDPYNVTQWQLTSLSRSLGTAQSHSVLIAQEVKTPPVVSDETRTPKVAKFWVLKTSGKEIARPREDNGDLPSVNSNSSFPAWFPNISFFWPSVFLPFDLGRRSLSDSLPPSHPEKITNDTEEIKFNRLLPRKYDLRPYGANLIVDFGWGRSPSLD